MAAAPDQAAIDAVAVKFQRGDFSAARDDCTRFLATVSDPARQAPLRFWLGIIEQRSGALTSAVEQFELALKFNRRHPQWLLQAGLAHFQLNALDRAEKLYREALRLETRTPLAHYNLGVLLQRKHDWAGARRAFEAAIMHQPQFPEAQVNLANTLVEMAEPALAEACYRRALEGNPRLANAHHGLGLLHLRQGRHSLAARCFVSAVEHDPLLLDGWLDLAECHHMAGDDARAIFCLEHMLAQAGADLPADAPAAANARYKLAQYRGEQPGAPPHALVARLYDGMAATFDEHLTRRLGYCLPTLLVAELDTWLAAFPAMHARLPAVLDLGCGTGLFGAEVQRFAASLHGVDLSASMLARARTRAVYDQLTKSDLVSYLAGTGERFDLIAATDVLIYVGRLEVLFEAVASRLAPGGCFAFSTETPAGLEQEFLLLPTGRYAHHARYIDRLASANAMVVTKCSNATIRTENGDPLAGHLFILQKT